MRLISAEFYQSVRLWNNQEAKTVKVDQKGFEDIEMNLEDHIVTLTHPKQKEAILIPTANLRHGRRLVETPGKADE